MNTGTGAFTLGASATVATFNVNVGGVTLSGGSVGTFNHNMGTSTIGAAETVASTNVNAGTLTFSSTRANGTLALPAGSTGTVIVGAASGGRLPTVAIADFSNTPSTGTVNATHPLAITSALKFPGGTTATLSNGTLFTASGANLANPSTPSTLGIGGGTLKFAVPTTTQSIAVHWSGYGSSDYSGITGADGLVSQSNWTNVSPNWYSGSASNLISSTGYATSAAVTCTLPAAAGTYWSALGPTAGVDNLLVGPGGGNGNQNGGANGAIPNAITGIPYSSYEIIGYLNSYESASGDYAVWLDGNSSNAKSTNMPASGSRYYYSPTWTNSTGFVLMTNNSNSSTYRAGNTVVWTGLTGSSQVLWTEGWSASGANDGYTNEGVTGFQIVNTAPAATAIDLPATAVSATSSSALDFGETGTPSQYHTLGNLSLTASTAGGTRLQLQDGLNVNFNGISAIYPTNGTGTMTASIAGSNGSASGSPVISLASGSSVSVGSNVTLTIDSNIGNPQTGTTALIKTGAGTLILSGADNYTAGTYVDGGTLDVTTALGLLSGTNLTVGDAADFAAIQPAGSVGDVVAPPAVSPVSTPEPGTLALLAAGAAMLAVYRVVSHRDRRIM